MYTLPCVSLQHLYSVHLAEVTVDSTRVLTDITQVFLAACDCLHVDISCLKLTLQASGRHVALRCEDKIPTDKIPTTGVRCGCPDFLDLYMLGPWFMYTYIL